MIYHNHSKMTHSNLLVKKCYKVWVNEIDAKSAKHTPMVQELDAEDEFDKDTLIASVALKGKTLHDKIC
jgi:hypothetical protein